MDDGGAPSPVVVALRREFDRQMREVKDEARALQNCAIELELSLGDCASALGKRDVLQAMSDSWRIEFPLFGPPVLRRP